MKTKTLCASCGLPATADTTIGHDGSLCAACEDRISNALPPWRQVLLTAPMEPFDDRHNGATS